MDTKCNWRGASREGLLFFTSLLAIAIKIEMQRDYAMKMQYLHGCLSHSFPVAVHAFISGAR